MMDRLLLVMSLVKKYWYLGLVALLTGLLFLVIVGSAGRASSLMQLLDRVIENFRKQVDVINSSNQKQKVAEETVREQFEEKQQQLEAKHEENVVKIEDEKKKRVRKTKKKSSEELAEEMKDKFKL